MPKQQEHFFRSIVIAALFMSLGALAIDTILPALDYIQRDLNIVNENNKQFAVSIVFIGMGFGFAFFGPFSDSFGRKKAIYFGVSIFILGNLVSYLANNFLILVLGRFLQGLGGSSCRVVIQAMIRDQFSGNKMAKVMSIIMIIFVLVPALAPSLGQLFLYFSHWRNIFLFMIVLSSMATALFYLYQPETLADKNKRDFSIRVVYAGVVETLKNYQARNFLIAGGLVFGAFVGYLITSQQILQSQYELGESFALAFGFLALVIGSASFVNSRLVESLGMLKLVRFALIAMVAYALVFLPLFIFFDGHPPLLLLLLFLALSFFSIGILFGNLNALAVESLGHIAGVANSVISSVQTIISVTLGGLVAYSYDGTVLPLAISFLLYALLALTLVLRVQRSTIS